MKFQTNSSVALLILQILSGSAYHACKKDTEGKESTPLPVAESTDDTGELNKTEILVEEIQFILPLTYKEVVNSFLFGQAKLAKKEGDRLIQVSETQLPTWMTQQQIDDLIRNRVSFMDVTGRNYPVVIRDPSAPSTLPTSMRFQTTVNELFTKLDMGRMRDFVTRFSEFHNRYYKSQLGVKSSNWLRTQIHRSISESDYEGNATVQPWRHYLWPQNSIVARIEGTENGVVLLGAHQDSINKNNRTHGPAPGADDNASGCVVLLEALRVMLASGIVPKKSIEFHWYAAEEVGRRGSQDIAAKYYFDGVPVVAMVNFDVVGYHTGVKQVSFPTDYTDETLNNYLGLVVEEYLHYTWTTRKCGYACSDHASWYLFGFRSASPFEPVWFPEMHTPNDTIDQVDFSQVSEFVKLALGYAVETAEPNL